MFTNSDFKITFGLTNITLVETIDNCVNRFFQDPEILVNGISKNDFRDLLYLVTKELFFIFNNKFYIQVDYVTIGSPLVKIVANIFLSHYEENFLQNLC